MWQRQHWPRIKEIGSFFLSEGARMADQTRSNPPRTSLRDRLGPSAYTVTLLTVVITFAALGATISVVQTRTSVPSVIPFLLPPSPQHAPTTGSITEADVPPPAPSSVSADAPQSTSPGVADQFPDCKALWDRSMHMTKRQWAAACHRAKQ
jgi:hypothetical protein